MAIEVNWTRTNEVLVAKPVGRIYSADYLDWQSELEAGIRPDDKKLVVDFSKVPYIGSAGLRILLLTARRFSGDDNAFAICQLRRPITKVIRASGFDGILKVYESADAAVAAMTGQADG
jgi:anti-anti-sigma factor